MYKPITKDPVTIHEKILTEIRSSILRGDLKPGERLPSERTLAELLSVSRTSIREALKILAASGILTIKHGKGIYIAEQSQQDLCQVFSDLIFTDQYSLEELYDMRKVLETQAVVWTVRRATEEQIKSLQQMIDEAKEKIKNENKNMVLILTEHDTKFHNALAEAAGNRVLVRVMQNLYSLIEESRTKAFSIPERGIKSLADHQKIVDAIASHDTDGARHAMFFHLESVEEAIATFIK